MHVCVSICACACVCMYVCMCVHMCMCLCVHPPVWGHAEIKDNLRCAAGISSTFCMKWCQSLLSQQRWQILATSPFKREFWESSSAYAHRTRTCPVLSLALYGSPKSLAERSSVHLKQDEHPEGLSRMSSQKPNIPQANTFHPASPSHLRTPGQLPP